MNTDERKQALQLHRDILAADPSLMCDHDESLLLLARLVALLLDRGKRMRDVYAAALALARARRTSPQWRNWHTERDALDEAARKALEMEEACP